MARNNRFGSSRKSKGLKGKLKSAFKKAAFGTAAVAAVGAFGYNQYGTVHSEVCKVDITQNTDYDSDWNEIDTYEVSACGKDFKDGSSLLHLKTSDDKIFKKMYDDGDGDGEYFRIKYYGAIGKSNVLSAKHLTAAQVKEIKDKEATAKNGGSKTKPGNNASTPSAPTSSTPTQPEQTPPAANNSDAQVAQANQSLRDAGALMQADGQKLQADGLKLTETGQKITDTLKKMSTQLGKISQSADDTSATLYELSDLADQLSWTADELASIGTGMDSQDGGSDGYGYGGDAGQVSSDAQDLYDQINKMTETADTTSDNLDKISETLNTLSKDITQIVSDGEKMQTDGAQLIRDGATIAATKITQPKPIEIQVPAPAPVAPPPAAPQQPVIKPALSGEKVVCTIKIGGKQQKISLPAEAVGKTVVKTTKPPTKLTAAVCKAAKKPEVSADTTGKAGVKNPAKPAVKKPSA